MAKLPKWAIRQAGGINKKAWALARRGRGGKRTTNRTRTAPAKRRTVRRKYNKKVVRHTRKSKLITKPFVDGLISGGGKVVLRNVVGANPIYEAGFDVLLGYFRNNKTLLGQGVVNGLTAFLPSLNLGNIGGGQEG